MITLHIYIVYKIGEEEKEYAGNVWLGSRPEKGETLELDNKEKCKIFTVDEINYELTVLSEGVMVWL